MPIDLLRARAVGLGGGRREECTVSEQPVYVLRLEETPAEELHGGGIVRRIITKGGTGMDLTFSVAELRPGAGHTWHTHETQDEAVFILEGEGTMSVEGYGDIHYGPGVAIVIKRGVKHQNRNTGTKMVRLVSMFNPALR